MRIQGMRILERRREMGLSLRTVAGRCQFSVAMLTDLEQGGDGAFLTVAELRRLAQALAVDLDWIVDLRPEGVAATDEVGQADADRVASLGALLSWAGVAIPIDVAMKVLGVAADAWNEMVGQLDGSLRACGQRIRVSAEDETVEVVPERSLVPPKSVVDGLTRETLVRRHIEPKFASLLHAVAAGRITLQTVAQDNARSVLLHKMTNAGLVESGPGGSKVTVLTNEVRYSLLMDERPHVPAGHRPLHNEPWRLAPRARPNAPRRRRTETSRAAGATGTTRR